jgi:hypothetical protein
VARCEAGSALAGWMRAARNVGSWPEQEQLGWRASTGQLAGGTGRVDAQELTRWSRAGGAGVEQQRVQVRCWATGERHRRRARALAESGAGPRRVRVRQQEEEE